MGKFLSFLVLGCTAMAVLPVVPSAQSGLIWQTSFDCPSDWDTSQGITEGQVCNSNDGLTGWGGWTTESGRTDEITIAANNPLGTGRGFRHWRGGITSNNLIGQNNNGGGVRIDVPGSPRNIWLRYYSRYQQGFRWSAAPNPAATNKSYGLIYTKELYINAGITAGPDFTTAFAGSNGFGLGVVYPGQPTGFSNAPGWNSIMGTVGGPQIGGISPGDGRWHAYEFHFDSVNGTMETWVDGAQNGRATGRNLSGNPINFILIGSNQCCVSAQPDMYTDYDDIAISTTGYIGLIGAGSGGGSSSTLPSAPQNLRVVP
jgi:hypothetical protein